MKLIEALNWRYATKRMNGSKVPAEKLDTILEAIRLSASSLGLQPYRVMVIENQELKNQIYDTACQQPQIKESSHVLVFAAWRSAGDHEVDDYMDLVAKVRGLTKEKLVNLDKSVRGAVKRNNPELNAVWFAKQAYIGLGFGLTAAALMEVDATPMEGFNSEAMDKLLGLEERNLHATCLLVLGFRDEKNDYLVNAKKVRLDKSDFFIFN